jgi:hypothetical protein
MEDHSCVLRSSRYIGLISHARAYSGSLDNMSGSYYFCAIWSIKCYGIRSRLLVEDRFCDSCRRPNGQIEFLGEPDAEKDVRTQTLIQWTQYAIRTTARPAPLWEVDPGQLACREGKESLRMLCERAICI